MTTSFVQRGVRAVVPYVFLPLSLLASMLSAAPWLRSFPASLAAVPLYGAAVLSVLVPLVVVRIRPSWLWLSVLVDAAVFVAFALVVVLRDPAGLGDLGRGLYRGPSEILTFALPLVSPRSLMIAPAALVWLAGALAGECVARRWYTLLPYVGFLVAFGLALAGTQRAAGADVASANRRETLLAAALLATLLLMRVAQAWVRQDDTAESTQPDGILPLRGLVVGTATTAVIAVVAAYAVQTGVFPKRAQQPQRVPTVDQSRPLAPLAFIGGLRPRSAKQPGRPVFTVTTDAASSGYFSIANVDFYDGSGWSFDRTFRPSGGVLPADTDPALQPSRVVTQQYRIADGPLTATPWMPVVYRAQKVTGTAVNIDPASGMIVPAGDLAAGTSYTVRSGVTAETFDRVRTRNASPDTATPTIDTQLPGSLRTTLDRLVHAFAQETGTPISPSLPFLQALQRDLRANYTLSNAAQGSSTGTVSSPAVPGPHTSTSSSPHGSPSASGHHRRAFEVRPLSRPSAHPSAHPTAHPTSHPASRPTAHPSAHPTAHPTAHPASHRASAPRPTPTPSASPSSNSPADDLAGATSFADVLASILGPGRSGTPEQFATLLALVARDLGVPARVATGFRVEPTGTSSVLAAGSYDVTTAQAWSWTEIPLNNVGWVVLDGAPSRFADQNKPTESGAPPPPSSSAPPSQNALITQGDNGNAVAPKSHVPRSASHADHALLVALLVVLGVLLLALVVVLLTRKRVRAARRRRVPDPRLRVIGAWQESLDVLTEAGLPELTTLTSAEIASLAGEQFGAGTGEQAASLGAAANSVAYSTATVVAAQDADEAWARHRSLRRSIRSQLGWRERLAAGLRYHRTRHTTGPLSPPSWATAATERAHHKPGGRQRGARRRPRAH